MYKRILLPLDGSPLAEQSLPHGIAIAERLSVRVGSFAGSHPVIKAYDKGRRGFTKGK